MGRAASERPFPFFLIFAASKAMQNSKTKSLSRLAALAVLGLVVLCYLPGLRGDFLFDDFANLPALGMEGRIHDAASLARYLSSGKADPTGRPLAMLSFLIDAQKWPADPFPFKRTNLVIHLFNGLLLGMLLRRLMSPHPGSANSILTLHKRNLASILAAGIWLLHPLFVSTTLYIVQREAMLSCSFVLMGLIAWLRGREFLFEGDVRHGLGWTALGLVGCTILATICKANGALLPVLALTIEASWLRHRTSQPVPSQPGALLYQRLRAGLLLLPTLLIALYLVYEGWRGVVHGVPSSRPWTLAQRLLTEPRVLTDYLRLLWMPQIYTPGLFNDQIKASTGILAPSTTLPAIGFVAALAATAWVGRHRAPALASAILFYFTGQLLESSTLGLELYYVHRNYLPAVLMFLPLALWLCGLNQQAELPGRTSGRDWHAFKLVLAALLVIGLGWMTWQRASLWGDTAAQALMWARLNPESPRAQAMAAGTELEHGRASSARSRMLTALRDNPDELQLALNLADAECQQGRLREDGVVAVDHTLSVTINPGVLMSQWLEKAIGSAQSRSCPGLDFVTLDRWLAAAAENPAVMGPAGRRQDWLYLRGRESLAQGRSEEALDWFDRALEAQVRPAAALRQAALLGEAGFPELGLRHLNYYATIASREDPAPFGMPRIHSWVLRKQGYWERDLAHLRATLQSHVTSHSSSS